MLRFQSMDAASLRIKFTPLLKKISNRADPDSKCCIEIVPELSAIQNLEKLEWRLENNLLEYTIPMTYKIMIKKQNQIKDESDDKVYHSCVDLLNTCSISDMNFASGDIMRITSDNVFLQRIPSSDNDNGDILITKDLLNTRNLFESILTRRTTSIQTLSPYEAGSLSSQRPLTADKSLEINIVNNNENVQYKKSNYTIVPNIYSLLALNNGISIEDADQNIVHEEEPTIITDNYKSEDVDTYSYGDSPEYSKRLSLSPICSINTYDILPVGTVWYKTNSSSYAFLSNTLNKPNNPETKFNPRDNDINQDVRRNIVLNRPTLTQLQEYQKNHNKTKASKVFHDKPTSQHVRIKNLDPVLNNNNDRNSTMKYGFMEPQNSIQLSKANAVHLANKKRKLKHEISGQNKVSLFRKYDVHENYTSVCNRDNNLKVLDVPTNYNSSLRVLPELRVADFLRNLESEINPLRQMLNEIKCKCMMLGLYNNEFASMAKTKTLIYKSIPNAETPKPLVQETCKRTTKSNRVVYTILFNE